MKKEKRVKGELLDINCVMRILSFSAARGKDMKFVGSTDPGMHTCTWTKQTLATLQCVSSL
jgi:hypothetical protein